MLLTGPLFFILLVVVLIFVTYAVLSDAVLVDADFDDLPDAVAFDAAYYLYTVDACL